MEPLQKNLDVHLAAGQELAVAKGPVWTGQARLHHPGGTAYAHQGHQGHYQVGGQQAEALEEDRV